MKPLRILTTLAAFASLPAAAVAQQANQTGVLGPSDNAIYTLRVRGSNDVIYNCKEDIMDVNGVPTRACIREGDTAGVRDTAFAPGSTGLAGGGAVAAGVIALVVVAAADGGSSTTTTTTNN